MRIYFLSEKRAALKLNGLYVGIIDLFERHVEMDLNDGIFAEILPDGNLQPLNFILDGEFLQSPPDFADVYLLSANGTGSANGGGDALIYIKQYADKSAEMTLIAQTRFNGCLVTAYRQGGVKLCCEGESAEIFSLPPAFAECTFGERTVNGHPVLAVFGRGALAILSAAGKQVFLNNVAESEFGERLKVSVPFETCTAARAECEFDYDGRAFTLAASRTVETRPPEEEILHFAFFECVLTHGDYSAYLCDELREKQRLLREFLGDFCDVFVPFDTFSQGGEKKTAGLVYPAGKNLYTVKYFSVETENGKITNIYETE